MNNPTTSFWSGRRVLVTGHTGFKGSWLSLWLNQLGAEVFGYALPPVGDECLFNALRLAETTSSHMGDICDAPSLEKLVLDTQPDVVFHLAAQPLVRQSYQDPVKTWNTNVIGSINVLQSLRLLEKQCIAVMVTTDKVYSNKEWVYGYRENDPLGGYDPYSSSKAAMEIAVASWRSSFCGTASYQSSGLRIASARAGNVIGGGDWAEDRIIPDIVRALLKGEDIVVRNPNSTRPWQHVLEPLSGYLLLAEKMAEAKDYATSFNFGPHLESNKSVQDLVELALEIWPGNWVNASNQDEPHEASLLNLVVDRAYHRLKWLPRWNFETTVAKTLGWYHDVSRNRHDALECSLKDLQAYTQTES